MAYGVVEDVSAEALVIRASPALALLVVAEDFDVNDVEAALAEEFVFRGDVVKMLPLAISYTYGSVEIDLDVDGARYLKFVKLCWGRVMKATVLEADNGVVAVKLADGIYGKLVVGDDAAAIDEATELGKQAGDVIDVVMCDFNPETNTIYLMAVDDEQASLRLTEA